MVTEKLFFSFTFKVGTVYWALCAMCGISGRFHGVGCIPLHIYVGRENGKIANYGEKIINYNNFSDNHPRSVACVKGMMVKILKHGGKQNNNHYCPSTHTSL